MSCDNPACSCAGDGACDEEVRPRTARSDHEAWDEAHKNLGMHLRAHGQTHTRQIFERAPECSTLFAVSTLEGARIFSLYCVDTDEPEEVTEMHLSPEAARMLAAFVTELDPGPEDKP